MRARSVLCLSLLLPFAAIAQEKVHMRIFLNGTNVGENQFERAADGAFTSKSNLDLGSIQILGTVTGHLKDGKLVDATSDSKGPSGPMKIVYAKGRVDLTANGKTNGGPWQDKTGNLAANLHPQFLISSLLAAEKTILANQASKDATIAAYFVDGGAALPLKISMQQPKTVDVGGKRETAKVFTVEVVGISMQAMVDSAGHVVAEDIPTQHIRFIADGWDAVFVDPISKFPELSQATFKTKLEKGVRMKTRDGVELVCDVVRPNDDEKHPAILVRTPYGRGAETAGGQFYASRGYAYVTQDCRGREDSGGEWDPFVNEGPDGYDTIQWVAAQPWCNGSVGMIGGSYSGYVQWAAAVLNPPALKCIVPQVSPPDGMRNIPYDHGVFALYANIWWAKIVAGKHTDFSSIKSSLPHPEKFNTLPLSKLDDAVLGEHLDFYNKWLSRPTIGDWKGYDFTYHMSDVKLPALHISGIWDGDEIGTHLNWNAMHDLSRDNQWIVFGPWVHAFNTNHSFGDVEYGPDAIIDLDSVFLRWFDTYLKGKNVGMEQVPHARLFVTGANKWVDLTDWPGPQTPEQTMYLSKAGLVPNAGKAETIDYTYDPAKDGSVPKEYIEMDSSKATTKLPKDTLKKGLVIQTPPMTDDLAIAGPFKVKLYFKTSALDTDFFAFLCDVAPNGETRMLGQPGKIRCSYLGGMDAVQPLTPGKEYLAEIEPWDFAHEFKKGHRMALLISSTMFPMFSRNLGTAEPIKDATRIIIQKNTILMGSDHPSSFSYHVIKMPNPPK